VLTTDAILSYRAMAYSKPTLPRLRQTVKIETTRHVTTGAGYRNSRNLCRKHTQALTLRLVEVIRASEIELGLQSFHDFVCPLGSMPTAADT
jgi:hypothetical protein